MLRHALRAAAFLEDDDAADHQHRQHRHPAERGCRAANERPVRCRPGKNGGNRKDEDQKRPSGGLRVLVESAACLVACLVERHHIERPDLGTADVVIKLRCRNGDRQRNSPEPAHDAVRLHRGGDQTKDRKAPDAEVDDQMHRALLRDEQVYAREEADGRCHDRNEQREQRNAPPHAPALHAIGRQHSIAGCGVGICHGRYASGFAVEPWGTVLRQPG